MHCFSIHLFGKKKQENLEEKKSAKKDRKIRKFEILDQKFFD